MVSVAVLTEAVIEYIKSVINMFTKRNYKTAVVQIAAIVVSVSICFAAKINLFGNIIKFQNIGVNYLLSGIVVSRGSNYVSDLLAKLK